MLPFVGVLQFPFAPRLSRLWSKILSTGCHTIYTLTDQSKKSHYELNTETLVLQTLYFSLEEVEGR